MTGPFANLTWRRSKRATQHGTSPGPYAANRVILAALVAEGFVEARSRPDGTMSYRLTESGRRLLDE